VTGVTPRNDEELAQSEVECREGKHPHVLWNMHLRLAVQTCVRQRKPRLLGMATFSDGYRFQGRRTIGYDIGSLDPPYLALVQIRQSKNTVGVYRGNPADNLWLIRAYHRAFRYRRGCSSPHHPPPSTRIQCQMSNTIALYAPFFPLDPLSYSF